MGCSGSSQKNAPQASTPKQTASDVPSAGANDQSAHILSAADVGPDSATETPVVQAEIVETAAHLEAEQAEAFGIVDDALAECAGPIGRGDVFNSESRIMDAIASITEGNKFCSEVQNAALARLRQSPVYDSTIALLKRYETLVGDVLTHEEGAGIPWIKSADVPVDYKVLETELSPEADALLTSDQRIVPMYWRQSTDKKSFEIKCGLLLPTMPSNATRPTTVGWIAMNQELDLYHTWHPIVAGKGPTELQARGAYHNLWHFMAKLTLLKFVELQEERMFFNHETGSHVLCVEDRDLKDASWETYPGPSGFRRNPNLQRIVVVCLNQEHTTFFGAHITISGDLPIPSWIVSLVVSWVYPEILKRLLRAGARALKSAGPHYPLIEADKQGVYAEAERLVKNARERDRQTAGVLYGPKEIPPADVVSKRARSLIDFDACGTTVEGVGQTSI